MLWSSMWINTSVRSDQWASEQFLNGTSAQKKLISAIHGLYDWSEQQSDQRLGAVYSPRCPCVLKP